MVLVTCSNTRGPKWAPKQLLSLVLILAEGLKLISCSLLTSLSPVTHLFPTFISLLAHPWPRLKLHLLFFQKQERKVFVSTFSCEITCYYSRKESLWRLLASCRHTSVDSLIPRLRIINIFMSRTMAKILRTNHPEI
jgi:hypothetical protein